MSRSPADILRAARIARGFASAAEAAREFGWSEVTYTSHENGTRGIRKDAAAKYAKAFGIDAGPLLGLSVINVRFDADQGVTVIGNAAWGVWRDTAMMHGRLGVTLSIPQTTRPSARAAVLISDDSVDKAIQSGHYAIYEPMQSPDAAAIQVGKLLVIRRTRDGLEELSVRRVMSALDGEVRLSSHSNSTQFREILAVRLDSPDFEIVGLVVGKYAPL